MIPQFPEFKKLELSDKDEIESFTRQFPPYSDFNFVSMWSWDIKGETRVSFHNGNLVVRFCDYLTSEPFYSFIGTNMVNETAQDIIEISKIFGIGDQLKLVPEITASLINNTKFTIQEEVDHFDYIVRLSEIRDYSHQKTKSRRRAVKGFLKSFQPEVKLLDLTDIESQNKVLQSFIEKSVQDNKITQNEFLAVLRFISEHKRNSVLLIGAFLEGELIGFCFDEVVNSDYVNFHFWRANTKISRSTYDYLLLENAKFLHERGYTFLNMEQDLGLDNLRSWKSSLGDYFFLKKYTVSLTHSV